MLEAAVSHRGWHSPSPGTAHPCVQRRGLHLHPSKTHQGLIPTAKGGWAIPKEHHLCRHLACTVSWEAPFCRHLPHLVMCLRARYLNSVLNGILQQLSTHASSPIRSQGFQRLTSITGSSDPHLKELATYGTDYLTTLRPTNLWHRLAKHLEANECTVAQQSSSKHARQLLIFASKAPQSVSLLQTSPSLWRCLATLASQDLHMLGSAEAVHMAMAMAGLRCGGSREWGTVVARLSTQGSMDGLALPLVVNAVAALAMEQGVHIGEWCRVNGAGCWVQGEWCRVQGEWCRVLGAG
eukprot:gene28763-31945_t